MEEIVEDALTQRLEDAVDEPGEGERTTGFGPPQCALIGCGEEGIARVRDGLGVRPGLGSSEATGEVDLTTVAVGSPLTNGSDEADYTLSVRPKDSPEMLDGQVTPTADALDESLTPLQSLSREWDVVVVTAHLGDSATTRLVTAVCRNLPSDATIIVVPTIPSDGLSSRASTAFRALVEAAGTTIPCDLARVSDAYVSTSALSTDPSSRNVHETADDVVGELVADLFGLFQKPLTTPVDTADARELLSTGGVVVAYRGWGTREDIPEALLEHAATHRLCDGDSTRIDGVLGLLRAGPTLELREYDVLYEHVSAAVRPPYVGRERWIRACRTANDLGDECTFLLLLTGISLDSLAFLDTGHVS